MSVEDLKAKIEQNLTDFTYTERDLQIVIDGSLSGSFTIENEDRSFLENVIAKCLILILQLLIAPSLGLLI